MEGHEKENQYLKMALNKLESKYFQINKKNGINLVKNIVNSDDIFTGSNACAEEDSTRKNIY